MDRPLLRVPPSLSRPPLLGGLSTRIGFPAAGGEDDEARRELSRAILARALGRSAESCAWAQQVHGAGVLEVRGPGFQGQGDALVSIDPRWILLVSVADCCPILVWSTESEAFGVVHAGWRGCVAGVVTAALQKMVSLGATPSGLRAWLGPCIGARKFEVGPEVAEQFRDEFVTRSDTPKPHVDLRAAVRLQLEDFGVPAGQITAAADCTYERPELYWSYRRDGGIEGRHLGYLSRAAG